MVSFLFFNYSIYSKNLFYDEMGGNPMNQFHNKVVVVTGAAQGIGKEVAKQYVKQGAKVVLADINKELGQATCTEIDNERTSIIFVPTDVRKEQDIIHLMNKTVETFGKLDILINNAGIFKPVSPYDLSIEGWDNIIHTNLRSVFLCSREAAKYMRLNSNGGSIVSMASTRAFMSEPHTETYAATKGGIISLTHAFASSFALTGLKSIVSHQDGLKLVITNNLEILTMNNIFPAV